jgi:hypothetical protein
MGLKKLPSRPRTITKNSGYLVQRDGRLGSKGNFELVINSTSEPSRLEYWYRDNDDPNLQWHKTSTFASNTRQSLPALIQSNFGLKGDFEVVFRNNQGSLEHWSRINDDPTQPWIYRSTFASNVIGRPALIQSNFGLKGDFEVVFRNENGGLEHWRRDNDNPNFPWIPTSTFASNVLTPPALIQSNFGSRGNFEVVFTDRTSTRLRHWYRNNDDSSQPWFQTR